MRLETRTSADEKSIGPRMRRARKLLLHELLATWGVNFNAARANAFG